MELDGLPLTVMPAHAVTLTFWPNQYDQAQVHTWPDFGKISSNIYEDIVFIRYIMVSACCDLDLWSQNLISRPTNPSTSVTKLGWNSLHWFLRYGVPKVFGTHSLTQTDRPEYNMPPAPFLNS